MGADAELDLDRTADIPLGIVRPRTRVPRAKPSSSSLGSSSHAPSQSQYGSRAHGARRLANIPDADETPGPSIDTWLATSRPDASENEARPARRRERLPSTQYRSGYETASVRERVSQSDMAEVRSAKAVSTSSRAKWASREGATSPRDGAHLDGARTLERVANWRALHAQSSEKSVPASLRKSASYVSMGDALGPRERRRPLDAMSTASSRRQLKTVAEPPPELPAPPRKRVASYNADSPLRNVLRWMAQDELQTYIPWVGGALLVLVRCLVGLGGYSGRGVPPMFGDFEAQRHWMELTVHLPPSRWYVYDLPYWGLDYPPLTAWVSWACGHVAQLFPVLRPALALHTSRGAESGPLVLFMRISVLVLEAVVYYPAVSFFLERRLEGRSTRARHVALYTVLLQPALLLIDHGHFQYNAVMLGLSARCFALLYSKLPNVHVRSTRPGMDPSGSVLLQRMLLDSLSRQISYEYVIAAIFFSLSLCFKQMALYYAPAVFAAMLGRCYGLALQHVQRGAWLFIGLATATVTVFVVVFLPWVGQWALLRQCLVRIFPLARGVFEDKVANVWCFLSVLPVGAYKLHTALAVETLAKVSLVTTLLALLPGCLLLFRASVETTRLETILDEAQAEQVVANVRRRTGSVVSGRKSTLNGSQRPPSVRESVAPRARDSTHDSTRGSVSDRLSATSGSLFAGSTSTMAGAARPRVRTPAPRAASSSFSPVATLLPYTLLSTSLAFFLFGFQTHEKSILLPLLPLTLLLTTKGDRTGAGAATADWEWAVLANNVGVFGLWPLLVRDGQAVAFLVISIGWCALIGYHPWADLQSSRHTFVAWLSAVRRLTNQWVHLAMAGLLAAEGVLPWIAPHLLGRYPDLFPVLNVLLVTPVLVLLFLWAAKKQVEIAYASGLLPSQSKARVL